MTKKTMGYLLPEGDAYEADLECMMLFYPNRKEYRQALFGALDYLATWLAWETDPDKRGKDAARSWRAAVLATRECIEMGTCENILELLNLIEANTRSCWCEGDGDITDGDQYTDEVEDGEGDVPQNIIDAGYAEDAADWDGFADYKCMISHLMVDNMEWQIREFAGLADQTGAILGGAAAIAAIAAVILATGGTALVLGIVIAIAGGSALYAAIAELGEVTLENLADAVAENHSALACAIYFGDGSVDAATDLKAAIDNLFTVPEAVVLKNLNLPAQLKALYAGRYDQQNVASILEDNGYETGDFDCTCVDLWYMVEGAIEHGLGFDENSNPCQFDSLTIPGDRDRVIIKINFDGVQYLGPMREIAAASIFPTGNVSRIQLLNQQDGIVYDSGVTACATPVSVMVGKTCSYIRLTRHIGVCNDDWFDLTVELV